MGRGLRGSATSGAHRVGVRVKWGGTSAIEGPGIVLFPWSATPFTPAPPLSEVPLMDPRPKPQKLLSLAALSERSGRLSFTPQGQCVLNELIQMKKFNTMDGLPQPRPPSPTSPIHTAADDSLARQRTLTRTHAVSEERL